MKLPVINTCDLKTKFLEELKCRKLSSSPGDYAYRRDNNDVPLYAVTGAVNIYAELGFDLGSPDNRREWAERINSFQHEDGSFLSPSGKEHAAASAIVGLNILGAAPRYPVKNLAPVKSKKLHEWLKGLDWNSTHKDFCSAVAPVLASGFYDKAWIPTLQNYINGLISPDKPLNTWCFEDDDPWRVISCIYHITSGYDAGFIPYPHPRLLWQRLCDLKYEERRNDVTRTICTDFDFVYILYRLVHQLPEFFPEFIDKCRVLFQKRWEEWHYDQNSILQDCDNQALQCYLIGWCVLQQVLPEQFIGPGLYDTQNAQWLYRLPSAGYVAS